MTKIFNTSLGRLRLLGFLEGISLLVLMFIAVPIKHFYKDPTWVKTIGPIHGALFLLFVLNAIMVAADQDWKFKDTTWKVIVACFIPFGTFYIDYSILKKLDDASK